MKLGVYNYVAKIATQTNPNGAATTWVVWENAYLVMFSVSSLVYLFSPRGMHDPRAICSAFVNFFFLFF